MEKVGNSGGPTRSTRLLWTAVVIAVVAFVLGVVGFSRAGVPFPSAVYNTLQLFTLNFAAPNSSGSYPVALEIARFLAPAVTLLAAATIAARLFRDEFDRTTARYAFRGAGNHVIVCGLGDMGTTAVRLLRRDHHVVAIERDRSCPAISTVRSLGVPVVVGDGRVERTLERAGVGSASLVIWTTGGFAIGSDVATFVVAALRGDDANRRRASRSVEDRPPACLVRVRDLGLCELLRRAVLTDRAGFDDLDVPASHRPPDPDIDYFNEWENTAQRLIWDALRGYAETPGDVELWVAGGGPLAEALVVQAVRTWRGLDPARTDARLAIHVFDERAGDQRDRFAAAWPEAARACDLHAHDGAPELMLAHARRTEVGHASAVFVLVGGRDRALELGLRLRELDAATPIAVAIPDSWEQTPDVGGALLLFDPVATGVGSDILFLDTYASLARMGHERYLNRHGIVTDEDGKGAHREWDDLEPMWRESNRDSARFVVPNLLMSKFDLVVPTESPIHVEEFGDDETEAMAAREHDRWRAFMAARGWSYGPVRDDDERTNPDLRPWDEVSEGAREYTRVVVRDYPRLLAQLGYEVWRAGDLTPDE
jgi:hypothetical protein